MPMRLPSPAASVSVSASGVAVGTTIVDGTSAAMGGADLSAAWSSDLTVGSEGVSVMSTMNARSPLAILGAVLLASSLELAGSAKAADGQPMTQMQEAAADEQVVLDDIVGAEIDVARGRWRDTVIQVQEAEIILLRAQQAGGYSAPQVLAALEQARMDLGSRSTAVGGKDIPTAEAAL